jgi:hypothetical protein
MSTDPVYLGPGYWASWHLKSLYSDTKDKKIEVARNIALDISNFPCLKCKNHSKEYVTKNPLLYAVNNKDPYSMFIWTFKFHNEVNLRIGKKVYEFEEAKNMWLKLEKCTKDCGEKDIVEEKKLETEEEKLGEMLVRQY